MAIGQVVESAMLHAVIKERDECRERLAEYETSPIADATICIPYYAQPEYLPETLASAIGQTAGLREVIVVDDGSPDNVARELCERYKADGAPVRYVRVTNRGLPNARNTGLMLAKGAGFVPLDSDDWLELTFLEKTLPLLSDYDVSFGGLQEHGPVRQGTYMPGTDRPVGEVTVELEWQANRLFYCAVYRTSLLREVGGWNGRMVNGYEDWDMHIDLLKRGARLGGVSEVLFNYRTRPDSMLVSITGKMHHQIVSEMHRHHDNW
jgi:hypothetical protein